MNQLPNPSEFENNFEKVHARAVEIDEDPLISYGTSEAYEKALQEYDDELTDPEKTVLRGVIQGDDIAGFDVIEINDSDSDHQIHYLNGEWLDPDQEATVNFIESVEEVDLDDSSEFLGCSRGDKLPHGKWDDSQIEISDEGNIELYGRKHLGNVSLWINDDNIEIDEDGNVQSGYFVGIDIDDEDEIDEDELPETLKVRSRSGGSHYYYYVSEDVDDVKNTQAEWGDLQSFGSNIIIPGSKVPIEKEKLDKETRELEDLGTYKIEEENEIAEWDWDDLPQEVVEAAEQDDYETVESESGRSLSIENRVSESTQIHPPTEEGDTDSLRRTLDALDEIDSDVSYSEWRNVGLSLAEAYERENAERVFDSWSSDGRKYDKEAQQMIPQIIDRGVRSRGIESENRATLGSTYHLAKKHGWLSKSDVRKIKSEIEFDVDGEIVKEISSDRLSAEDIQAKFDTELEEDDIEKLVEATDQHVQNITNGSRSVNQSESSVNEVDEDDDAQHTEETKRSENASSPESTDDEVQTEPTKDDMQNEEADEVTNELVNEQPDDEIGGKEIFEIQNGMEDPPDDIREMKSALELVMNEDEDINSELDEDLIDDVKESIEKNTDIEINNKNNESESEDNTDHEEKNNNEENNGEKTDKKRDSNKTFEDPFVPDDAETVIESDMDVSETTPEIESETTPEIESETTPEIESIQRDGEVAEDAIEVYKMSGSVPPLEYMEEFGDPGLEEFYSNLTDDEWKNILENEFGEQRDPQRNDHLDKCIEIIEKSGREDQIHPKKKTEAVESAAQSVEKGVFREDEYSPAENDIHQDVVLSVIQSENVDSLPEDVDLKSDDGDNDKEGNEEADELFDSVFTPDEEICSWGSVEGDEEGEEVKDRDCKINNQQSIEAHPE